MKQHILYVQWVIPFTIEEDTIGEINEWFDHIKYQRDYVGYWWEDGWRGLPV
jgi:hypothetical protein